MITDTYGLKLIYQNQSQKEIFVNEALNKIDKLLNAGIVSKSLTVPPEHAYNGDMYIIGKDARGAWEGNDHKIALYMDEWHFILPRTGMLFWILDEEELIVYHKGNWQPAMQSAKT